MTCRNLVPQSGIKPVPPALGAWSLKHWTTRKSLILILNLLVFKVMSLVPWCIFSRDQFNDFSLLQLFLLKFKLSHLWPLETSSNWCLCTFAMTIIMSNNFLALWHEELLQAHLRSGIISSICPSFIWQKMVFRDFCLVRIFESSVIPLVILV